MKLVEQFARLPGIGGKSAQRLAFHIIHMPKEQVEQLTDAIKDARENICYCKECYTLTDQELCPICANPQRDHHTIMVVESTATLRLMRRPESMTVFITSCTGRSLRCSVSVLPISA